MRALRSASVPAGGAGLLLLALSAALSGEDAPPAPQGFSWKRLEPVKASFLMPDGWHFKQEEQQGTRAFFITLEDIDKSGSFETGLTVNVQKVQRDKAPGKAAQFIVGMMQGHQVLDQWAKEAGVMKIFGCRVRETEKGHPPLVIHVLALGNERTNTLYVVMFESPESSWDAAWAKGRVMLETFRLDDEV
ncbi:MAG: hypothetical protein ACM3SU_16530 [Acidobacteriota bacterium]